MRKAEPFRDTGRERVTVHLRLDVQVFNAGIGLELVHLDFIVEVADLTMIVSIGGVLTAAAWAYYKVLSTPKETEHLGSPTPPMPEDPEE